jgi:adenylosuccinate synthase
MGNEILSTKIALLEQNQKTNEQIHQTMMEQFKQYNEENKEQHSELKTMIVEMRIGVKEAMEKKAGVWVEKAFTWLLYTVAGIIVGTAMYLIIKFGAKI